MALNCTNLIKSPEYRGPLLYLLLLQAFLVIAGLLFSLLLLDYQSRLMDERFFALVSRTVSEYPRAEEEILRTVTAKAGWEEAAAGRELLSRYGYTQTTPLYLKPPFAPLVRRLTLQGILLCLLTAAGSLAVYHFTRVPLLRKIDKLSETSLAILRGASPPIPAVQEEGLFPLLKHRHNQLVRKMQAGAEKLGEEKLFLKQVLSDISHQLKTPMASLVMYTDLMLQDLRMPEDRRREFLACCSSALERMEHLVKNLLKLARLEAGAMEFRKTAVDLKDLLEKMISEGSIRMGNRTVTVIQEEGISALLETDPHWIREVFSNLLENALAHTDNEGAISFTLRRTPLFLRVRVTDDGEGIPEEDLPRIFERFYRSSHRSRNGDSAGIGLALCRTILSALGGDIRADSPPDRGAEFTVTFPYTSVS